MKKYKLVIFTIIISILTLCACNKTQNAYLKDIIDLSTVDVESIIIAKYDVKPTKIEEKDKLQKIYSFLNGIKVKSKYEEKTEDNPLDGDSGLYIGINYKNGKRNAIEIFDRNNTIKVPIKQSDPKVIKYKLFHLSNSINEKELKEIFGGE